MPVISLLFLPFLCLRSVHNICWSLSNVFQYYGLQYCVLELPHTKTHLQQRNLSLLKEKWKKFFFWFFPLLGLFALSSASAYDLYRDAICFGGKWNTTEKDLMEAFRPTKKNGGDCSFCFAGFSFHRTNKMLWKKLKTEQFSSHARSCE